MQKVTVLRAFCLAGLRQEVGQVVEVTPALAAELVAYGKASREVAPAVASEAPAKRKARKENE